MAIAILRAVKGNNGKFDGTKVLKHFHQWSRTHPPDIGQTTAITLKDATLDAPYNSAKAFYERSKTMLANGRYRKTFCIEIS
jgi:hypothetical protein